LEFYKPVLLKKLYLSVKKGYLVEKLIIKDQREGVWWVRVAWYSILNSEKILSWRHPNTFENLNSSWWLSPNQTKLLKGIARGTCSTLLVKGFIWTHMEAVEHLQLLMCRTFLQIQQALPPSIFEMYALPCCGFRLGFPPALAISLWQAAYAKLASGRSDGI